MKNITILIKILLITLVGIAPAKSEELRDLINQAMESYSAGNCTEALPLFDDILSANLTELDDNTTLLYSLNYYAGYCANNLGNYDQSLQFLSRALAISPDKEQIPVLHTMLGDIEKEKGYYKKAEHHYNLALALLEDNSIEKAVVLYYLADLYRLDYKYNKALETCDNVTVIATAQKLAKLSLACMVMSGEIYFSQEDYPGATKAYATGLHLARSSQMPLEMAHNYAGLGQVYEKLNNYDAALSNYDEAMRLYVAAGYYPTIPDIAYRIDNLPEVSKELAEKSLQEHKNIARQLEKAGEIDILIYMQLLIGAGNKKLGNSADAVKAYSIARDFARFSNNGETASSATLNITDLLIQAGEQNSAIENLQNAVEYEQEQENSLYISAYYAKLGEIYLNDNNLPEAEKNYKLAVETELNKIAKDKHSYILEEIKLLNGYPMSAGADVEEIIPSED